MTISSKIFLKKIIFKCSCLKTPTDFALLCKFQAANLIFYASKISSGAFCFGEDNYMVGASFHSASET